MLNRPSQVRVLCIFVLFMDSELNIYHLMIIMITPSSMDVLWMHCSALCIYLAVKNKWWKITNALLQCIWKLNHALFVQQSSPHKNIIKYYFVLPYTSPGSSRCEFVPVVHKHVPTLTSKQIQCPQQDTVLVQVQYSSQGDDSATGYSWHPAFSKVGLVKMQLSIHRWLGRKKKYHV